MNGSSEARASPCRAETSGRTRSLVAVSFLASLALSGCIFADLFRPDPVVDRAAEQIYADMRLRNLAAIQSKLAPELRANAETPGHLRAVMQEVPATPLTRSRRVGRNRFESPEERSSALRYVQEHPDRTVIYSVTLRSRGDGPLEITQLSVTRRPG